MNEQRSLSADERQIRSATLEELMPLMQERLNAGQRIRFAPRGTSMLPMLRPGRDQVELSPAPERLAKYDLPLYRRDDGTYILHRIAAVGETYSCAGDNQFQTEHGVRRDQIIAVVTSFNRGGREYSVDDAGYQLYCRFWHHTRGVRRFLGRAVRWIRRQIR